MADRLHEGLSKLLDQYDARRRVDAEREQKSRDDDARFLARFAELRRDVVRPVFESAGALLGGRGHAFSISEQEFSAGAGGAIIEAGISLHVLPAGMAEPENADHARTLSLTTRHYNKTVWINAGRALDSGGVAGAKGAHSIERIDRQLVEDEVLRFVGALMDG